MQTTTCSTAVGVFTNTTQADRAVDALFDAGFENREIGVITRDDPSLRKTTATTTKTEDEAESTATGAATGALAGAGIGALVGWGVLAGAVPVIGPALFAGTLGVLASNAAGGAAAVGIIGALTGWGVSEEDAKHYESEVVSGRVVVTVTSEGRCEEAREILRQYGATTRESA